MAGPKVADRVKETSTTEGTGTYDLGGAATGFQTFVAGVGTGNTCYYCATDGTDWEVGIGTVTDAATDTLSRDTILASSNAGAAVNWGAGTKDVFLTAPAASMVTEWESWTPTSSWTGGISVLAGRKRWVGDTVELEFMLVTSGGVTPQSTDLYFTLPSGVAPNTSKMAYGGSAAGAAIQGEVWYRDLGVGDFRGGGVRLDTTNSRVYPTTAAAPETKFKHNVPITFAASDHVWVRCSFPATQS